MNVSTYIDYFRQFAISHKDLRHDIATESDGEGRKAFARFSPDEIATGQRTQVDDSVLYLELYETNLQGEPYSIQQPKSGAVAVYFRGEANNFTLEQECFQNAERVMDDLLNKIWLDHYGPSASRCKTPFQYFYFDKANVMPVGPLFLYYFGYRCEFNFKLAAGRDYSKPLPPNTFI